ncbi:hypothetical protein N7468_003439 [Penicillium chermesinum]|uniref:Uncharacterized protein n=1 Tax=Penicillium chermesinum TaxID=63820 RepID=A0A9W9P6L7_9EURO|nr:uncharacterized protein N7468_003439 [Penicillium chermesinum]KAJ5238820.1 hypothetical protein N7468_003439 [Penicillium chermesinum]
MWDSLQRALDTVSVGYDRIAVIDLLQRAGKVPSEEEQAFVDNFDAAQGELDEKIPILSRWISRLEARERQAFCDLNPEVVGRYNILVAPDPDRSHINN